MQRNNRLYLVGSGRLFLFIILKDKNDESEKINDQRAEGKKHFDGYVHLPDLSGDHLPSV
jgi:hypothetical protein